jgi:hypothetical protein
MVCSAFIFRVKQSKKVAATLVELFDVEDESNTVRSKRRKLFASRNGLMSHKTCIFSNAATSTLNLT